MAGDQHQPHGRKRDPNLVPQAGVAATDPDGLVLLNALSRRDQRRSPGYTALVFDDRGVALANLREVLELHFEPPVATHPPPVHQFEVEIGAA